MVDIGANCLTCSKFVKCKDPHKSALWRCNKYKLNSAKSADFLSTLFNSEVSEVQVEDSVSNEFELEKLISDMLDTPTGIPRDIKVNDFDLKEFPNFYSFCTSPVGLNIIPYARQLAVAMHLFHEWCPRCSDPKWSKDRTILSVPKKADVLHEFPEHIVFLEYGVCPKCKANKVDLFRSKHLYFYEELALCWGQRSGKSAETSMLVCYLIHKYLKMQKPSELLGLLNNSVLYGTVVALTFAGAIKLLWTPIQKLIGDSPWFTDYHSLLNDYGNKYGTEILRFEATFMEYRHRNMFLYPSGPNRSTLRGDTRFLTAIDEIGWMTSNNDDAVKMNADEIYKALDRSLLTVRKAAKGLVKEGFYSILPAYAFNTSSPSSARDKIMSLVTNNVHSTSIYVSHAPTWEINPRLERKDFVKEYEEDAVKAERDFGANPPLTDSPFIEDADMVGEMFHGQSVVDYQYIHKKNNSGKIMRAAKVTSVRKQGNVQPAILTMDAGASINSFALVAGHRSPNPKVRQYRYDCLVEISPEKERIPLNFTKIVREVVFPLIRELNVKVVMLDRWQSIKICSDIEDEFPDVKTFVYSVTYDDFLLVKSHMMDGTMVCPKMGDKAEKILQRENKDYPNSFRYDPASHLFYQCLTVREGRNTVEKGTGGMTDDLFRALVLAQCHLADDEWADKHLQREKAVERSRVVGVHGSIGGAVVQQQALTSGAKGIASIPSVATSGGGLVFARQFNR